MKYLETHPWINFELDIRLIQFQLWMALGEAQSKCHHISGTPLLPEIAQDLHSVYLAKGALATTAIEGNTLTEEEVKQHIKGNLELPKSKQYLQQEISNILDCCNLIGKKVVEDESLKLTIESIKEYNRMILKDLPKEDDVIPGEMRNHSVTVGRYRGAPAEECEYLMTKLCDWIENKEYWGAFPQEYKIALGVLKAIVAHVYLAWIHPFGDGNGRTARIIELQLLIQAGVPSAAAHLLSNHYNQTRNAYYLELQKTSKKNDLTDFIAYAIQGFTDGLKEQIKQIKSNQWRVSWEHLVHSIFKDATKTTQVRKRNLLLDLANQNRSVPFSEIRTISIETATAYAGKTDKTIRQDLNCLIKDYSLVEKTTDGYRARVGVILAFLPLAKRELPLN